jgi:DNA-binding CsgD family transcriptional regulator
VPDDDAVLTRDEMNVLLRAANGTTIDEIASRLRVARPRIEAACAAICRKLGARTVTQAVFVATDRCLIGADAAGRAVPLDLTPKHDPDFLDVHAMLARRIPIRDRAQARTAVFVLRNRRNPPNKTEMAERIGISDALVAKLMDELAAQRRRPQPAGQASDAEAAA